MLAFLAQHIERIGSPLLGIIIPLVILIMLFPLTWWLYVHFSEEQGGSRKERKKEGTFGKALREYFWGRD